MNYKKIILLLTITLILIQSAQSLEIVDAKITWQNETVNYYSHNTPLTINLHLTINTPELQNTILNISDLNNRYVYSHLTNKYDSINVNTLDCQSDEETHICTIRNIILRTDKPEIKLIAKQNNQQAEKNITLQRTTANPEATFIGTESCHSNICYIKPGLNNILIKLTGSEAGFSRGTIGFKTTTTTGTITSCDENECTGYLNIQCADGQELNIEIGAYRGRPSRDDAGRVITSEKYKIICDANPPEIQNMTIMEARDIGITEINEQFRISANVTDTVSPTLTMKVLGEIIGTENVTGDCALREGQFKCIANIKPQVTEKGFYSIPVIFEDAGGNIVQEAIQVELLEIINEEIPNFWQTGTTKQSLNSLTFRNMGYQREIFIEVPLTGTAELIQIKPSNFKCQPTQENLTGRASHIVKLDLFKLDKENNKAYMKVTMQAAGLSLKSENHAYSGFNRLEYNCGLDILSKKDNYFYTTPEQKNFTLKFDISKGFTLDEKVYQRLESSNARVQELEESVQLYEGLTNMYYPICSGIALLDASTQATAAVTLILSTIPGVGTAAAKATEGTSQVLKNTHDGLGPLLVQGCKVLTCELVPQLLQKYTGDTAFNELVQDTTGASISQAWNPYKSEFVAWGTFCIPAIAHHQRTKQGIECSYINCIEEGMGQMGLALDNCNQMKEYDDCLKNSADIIYAVPFTSIVSDLASDLSAILRDPVALIAVVPFVCNIGALGLCPGETITCATCILTQTIVSLPGHYARIQSLIEQIGTSLGVSGERNPVPEKCEPILRGSVAVAREKFEIDGELESFDIFSNDRPDSYTSSVELEDDKIMNCAGTSCKVYESNEPDAKLVNIIDRDFDGNVKVYDADGKTLTGVVDLATFDQEFVHSPEFRDVVNLAVEQNTFFEEYKQAYPDAYGYQEEAVEIRQKMADRIEQSDNTRKEYQPIIDLYDRDDVGRQTTIGDLFSRGIEENLEDYDNEFNENKFQAETGMSVADFNKYVRDLTGNDNFDISEDGSSVFIDDEGNVVNLDDMKIRDLHKQAEDKINEPSSWSQDMADLKAGIKETIAKLSEQYHDASAVFLMRQAISGSMRGADLLGFRDRDWAWWGEDSVVGQVSTWIGENIGQPERMFCDAKLNEPKQIVSTGTTGGLVTKQGAGHTPGAFISFRKSSPIQEPGSDEIYYDYWVEGGIKTNTPGLKYKIYAYDSRNQKHDLTERITREEAPEIMERELVTFGTRFGEPTHMRMAENYQRMCIYFDVDRLSRYFDIVSMSGKELCQTAIQE